MEFHEIFARQGKNFVVNLVNLVNSVNPQLVEE